MANESIPDPLTVPNVNNKLQLEISLAPEERRDILALEYLRQIARTGENWTPLIREAYEFADAMLALRVAIIVLVLLLSATSAHAQALRTATQVFAATAVADWTTTSIGLSRKTFTEINPSLAWTHSDPALTVAAGTAMDVAGVWALHRFVGRKHPRVAAVALYAQAAARVYFVSRASRFIAEQRQ